MVCDLYSQWIRLMKMKFNSNKIKNLDNIILRMKLAALRIAYVIIMIHIYH
jgi:hypothetical protein